jgi:hypothetical protein
MNEATIALAALVGVLLGALGGGGSILTVPVLVYAAGFDPKLAIAMSLPVVAMTSAAGAVSHWHAGHVQLRPALLFGSAAMLGAYLGAQIGLRVAATFQLFLLAVVMLGASISMLRARPSVAPVDRRPSERATSLWLSAAAALAIGVLTGLIGIGGGFLFVPVLVVLGRVPVRDAVGTSLVVIAMNAAAGLAGYAGAVAIPWPFVLVFAAMASAGALAGVWVARVTPPRLLQQAFAVLLLTVAAAVLVEAYIHAAS